MRAFLAAVASLGLCLAATALMARASDRRDATSSWNERKAAEYLDGRLDWWLRWPNAARDHDTACVSCHTAVPYALARPALQATLGDRDLAAPERTLMANVLKRVRLWKEVEPFYPDQTRGLPKSSESRGTEAVLNALILATRDASAATLSEAGRHALENMWALQFKVGDIKGAWAWLNFRYEPWESTGAPYYGATLAAIAAGSAPGGYSSETDVQDKLKLLRDYLQQRVDAESLHNRVMALWASSKLPGTLNEDQRQAIVAAVVEKQQADGGWSTSALGSWKRLDGTPLDTASDGYATGLVSFVLQQSGSTRAEAPVSKGLAWLVQHQDAASGGWLASSLNKQRDPTSDAGKFMNDAATAYAVLALTHARSGSTSARHSPLSVVRGSSAAARRAGK